MRTVIILPTYQERENLRAIVERIACSCIPDLEVLIVDDASPDGTGALAEKLRGTFPFLRIIHRDRKGGLGAALLAGFHAAIDRGADVIVQMDADGSHDPAEILRMLVELSPASITVHPNSRADLVVGSRRIPGGRIVGWGIHRRCASWGAQALARALFGLRTRDVTSGFRAWRAGTLARTLTGSAPSAAGYAFQGELLSHAERLGLRIVEHPITFRDRERGRSKLGWRDVVEFFRVLARLRWREGKLPHPDGITTWSRLPQRERRFALWLGVLLVLLTGLPTLYGWLRTPPGYTFTGISGMAGTAGDQHVYYSDIEQARDGALIFRDLYTGESTGGRMVQLPWLAVGILARWTGWSAPLAFHVARLLLIIPFTAFLAVVVGTFLPTPIAGVSVRALRRTAILLTTLGMGTGALLGWPILPYIFDELGRSNWPMDFWVPEAFPFLAMSRSPHFILSLWLMLAVYLATVRADATRRFRWMIAGALAAALLVAIHPFYIPSIAVILTAYAIVRMVQERRFLPHLASYVAIVSAAMLPASTYWGLLAFLDPIHAARAAQNILRTGPLSSVLLSYGFFVPFAVVGAVALVRARRRDPAATFCSTWAAVNALLLFAPLPWQRRFAQGFSVILALLATVGIAVALRWLRARGPTFLRTNVLAWRPALVAFAVLAFGFTTAVQLIREVTHYTLRFPQHDPTHIFYYPTAGINAMRWLRSHTDPTSVALAPGITANFLPGWAARPIFAGHNVETAHAKEKILAFGHFLEPATPTAERWGFLRTGNIDVTVDLHVDPRHEELAAIARALALPIAYANDQVTIYRVPRNP